MANSRKAAPDLLGAVLASLNPYLAPGSRLALGYSGGLDSSVLLHILTRLRPQLGFSLVAVHVHHGLSPRADAWADHCQRVCNALDVRLERVHVTVTPQGQGLEAAARQARYRVFSQLDVDFVALAHHRDDQAETVLLQLLRGADLKGLAAMPMVRALDHCQAKLLRPLLDFSRAELAAYTAEAGLSWVEDDSNNDTRLTRNALRHEVLPALDQHLPGSGLALARAAAQFAEQAELVDALARLDGAGAIEGDSLDVARLAALPEARARNLLRYVLEQMGGAPRRDALREVLRQLLYSRPDAQVRLDFGPVSLRRFHGRVWCQPRQGEVLSASVTWRGEADLDLAGAGRLHFQQTRGQGLKLDGAPVTIRRRQGGEHLRLDVRRPARTLKNLLREAGVPPWQRQALPLLYLGERLVWAAGVGMDVACRAGPEQPGWLISWRMPG